MTRALMLLALVAACEKREPDKDPGGARARDATAAAAELIVETDRVLLGDRPIADVGGAVDQDTLATVLGARRGTIVVAVAPAATYQRLVDVLDAARRAGLQPELDLGDQRTEDLTPRAATGGEVEPILVLTLSTDAIFLGQDAVASLSDLGDAIAKRAKVPDKLAIVADRNTRGDVLVPAIAAARAAGVGDVFFVTEQMMAPPPRMPAKVER